MKKNTIAQNPKGKTKSLKGPITIGMDLGDKTSRYCALDSSGEVVKEGSVATAKKGMMQLFGAMQRCRIAIEVEPIRLGLAGCSKDWGTKSLSPTHGRYS